jgi:hypothetical protein
MADRRLQAGCEVLREAGLLIGVLYPLEKSIAKQGEWLWILLMEIFATTLVVCGIILDGEEGS